MMESGPGPETGLLGSESGGASTTSTSSVKTTFGRTFTLFRLGNGGKGTGRLASSWGISNGGGTGFLRGNEIFDLLKLDRSGGGSGMPGGGNGRPLPIG